MIPGMKHADKYCNAYMDLGIWNFQKDCYLSHVNNGEIEMETPGHIFLVEKSEISVFSQGGHRVNVMASEGTHFTNNLLFQIIIIISSPVMIFQF